MSLQRTLEGTVESASAVFPVVLVTGARQVGKTTMLRRCSGESRGYVTLDDPLEAQLAQTDPALFFQRHPPPVLIDEIQYAPDLMRTIKLLVDRSGQAGQFWLTGSQKFRLMQGVTESLAGRVAVLDLLGMSQAEIAGRAESQDPFLPNEQWLSAARSRTTEPLEMPAFYQRIWRGSYPQVALDDRVDRDLFYSSYVQTYLQRDVRDLAQVGDEGAFLRLLQASAARTGQLINFADLARDVGVDQKTVKSWLSILETSGIIRLLQPYHTNVSKRLIKTPKLYMLDTGLCAYLTQWSTPETLEAGAMGGPILETWFVAEILRSWQHNGRTAPFFFYRDRDGREIDLLIEQDGLLYPIEFKKSASPKTSDTKHFDALDRLGVAQGPGAVLCLCLDDVPLTQTTTAIPASYL